MYSGKAFINVIEIERMRFLLFTNYLELVQDNYRSENVFVFRCVCSTTIDSLIVNDVPHWNNDLIVSVEHVRGARAIYLLSFIINTNRHMQILPLNDIQKKMAKNTTECGTVPREKYGEI